MKKILFISLIVIVSASLYSQAPEGFSYRAIVRNNAGEPIVTQAVSFRFSILKGSPLGNVVYGEKHDVTTDKYGAVSLVIGNGTDKIGDFITIDWGADNYFLKVKLDTTGGTNYTYMGTTQLQSVPYTLYAKTAANGFSGNYNDLTNKPITNSSETKITVGNNLIISGSGTIVEPYLLNTRTHYIGEQFGGGIVFYVYDNGQHGLIAPTADQDPGIEWYNGIKRYTNTSGDGLGAGAMNTSLIIALQTTDNQVGNFAAKVCADYSVTVDGVTYGDWYLPSKHELDLLFNQKTIVGGFANDYYWSSTEFSSHSAWSQNFSIGFQYNLDKSLPYGVRAIRAF
ncbi:MAG: DUF1566 domain-containing protein [Bacteroidetes bacterium]|nr:DUF1566 domain-containing protein [Bacteroidota bacterium]